MPGSSLSLGARNSGGNSGAARKVVRLCVLVHMLGDFSHDWYSHEVIDGADSAAHDAGVTVELLGDRDGDVKMVSRRLIQSRPDVLAICAPPPPRALLIGEAQRLGIPSIGTGSLRSALGVA